MSGLAVSEQLPTTNDGKPLKERRPSRIDGLWIFLPAPVILFNQVQIRASIN